MAKHFSFVTLDVTPLSQNNRSTATITNLQTELRRWHNIKCTATGNTVTFPRVPLILANPLTAKVFYIHKDYDKKDADNISKPLWDSLNKHAYDDDRQIKYLETLKVKFGTNQPHDIFELDVTDMDDYDFLHLYSFMMDPANTYQRFMYIKVTDFEAKKVKF